MLACMGKGEGGGRGTEGDTKVLGWDNWVDVALSTKEHCKITFFPSFFPSFCPSVHPSFLPPFVPLSLSPSLSLFLFLDSKWGCWELIEFLKC